MKSKEEIDQEEHIKFQQIGFILSEHNKKQKQIQEPFLKRLLLNREQCTKSEQNLYNFIYQNWLWCMPVFKHKQGQSAPNKQILVGHRIINKEFVIKHIPNFAP